jgi:hypothetical protein
LVRYNKTLAGKMPEWLSGSQNRESAMKKRQRPNYHWWVNVEIWTLTQATLLLHGLDPNQHKSLKPYAKNLLPEYTKLKKTYLILQQYPWEQRLPQYYYAGKGIHPVAIISLAIHNQLPLSKRLKKLVAERFHRENEQKTKEIDIQQLFSPCFPVTQPSPPKAISRTVGFTARERKNLLRCLGILIRISMGDEHTSPRHWYADHLNAYQIAQTILEKAQKMGISTKGLKSLDRKITEAMALLYSEQEE